MALQTKKPKAVPAPAEDDDDDDDSEDEDDDDDDDDDEVSWQGLFRHPLVARVCVMLCTGVCIII